MRRARSAPADTASSALWFATASPAYPDKNNASTIHAALRLDTDVPAIRLRRRAAIGVGALRTALDGNGSALVVAVRHARRPSDERRRVARRRRRAPRCSSATTPTGPVIAEYIGAGSATEEFIERWRTPGSDAVAAVGRAFRRDHVRAARRAGVERGAEGRRAVSRTRSTSVIVTGTHARAVRGIGGRLGAREGGARRRPLGDASATPAPRTPRCCSPSAGDGTARPGHRARRARRRRRRDVVPHHRRDRVVPPARTGRVTDRHAADLPYGKFLSWRGDGHIRAAAPPRARPHLGVGVGPHRRMEVRVRRLARPRRAASCTCRRRASRGSATRSTTWTPAPMADVQGTIALLHRSTASRTRRARRSCSRSSTSTAAAACRSSSPTSMPTRCRSATASR